MDSKRYRFSNTGHTQNVGSRYFMVWLYWICIDIDRIRYQHLYWFSHPFRPAKRSKKTWAIFRICFIATLAILLVYSLYMKLMGQLLEI